MSILDFFRRRRRGQPPSRSRPDAPHDAPVCVAAPTEDPASDAHADAWLEDGGWWVPDGECCVNQPTWVPCANPVEAELNECLRRACNDTELELPTLPRVAQRALGMLQDEDVDYLRLAKVIQDDPAIAARVLRMVNSTAYSRLFKISRIDLAFARLGRRTLQSIILAMTLKNVTVSQAGPQREAAEEQWQHSIVSAALLAEMGRRYQLPDDEAFLVGLLHDIGKLAVMRILETHRCTHGTEISRSLADQVGEGWHEPLGHRLATAWRLQEPLPEIIGNHHSPPADNDPWGHYRALVQFADVASAMMGYTAYVPYDFFNLPCVRALKIEDDAETRKWLASFPALILERTAIF